MSATARYIITADDKTKAAIASVNAGFRNMERGIKGTVSRMNAALGLVAGIGIKRAFQNVFTETAKGSADFAAALDDVRRSARGLLAAKDGVPGATVAMRELAEVLKDPELVAAADRIASSLIRGFSNVLQFATGVKTLREEIDELKRQKAELEAGGGGSGRRSYIKGEPQFIQGDDRDLRIANADVAIGRKESELAEQERRQREAEFARQRRIYAAGDAASRRFNTMREFEENIKFFEDLDKQESDSEYFDRLAAEADIAATKMRQTFFEQIAKDAADVGETLDRNGDSIGEFTDKIGDSINKTAEWSVAADQAARNIQDSFADFLFDPFQDGLNGMLKGFIDVIRRIAAETAAAKIFGSKSSGGLGAGDFISGLLGGLFGGGAFGGTGAGSGIVPGPTLPGGGMYYAASGTNFVEKDNSPFMLHKGEAVIPAKYNPSAGGMGGSPNVNITTHIDARGATMELTRALPEILRRNNDDLESKIVQRIKRRQYNLG